jgi:hypothetical protein
MRHDLNPETLFSSHVLRRFFEFFNINEMEVLILRWSVNKKRKNSSLFNK